MRAGRLHVRGTPRSGFKQEPGGKGAREQEGREHRGQWSGLRVQVIGPCFRLTRRQWPSIFERQFFLRDERRARAPVGIATDELGDEAYSCGFAIGAVLWLREKTHVVGVGLGSLEGFDAQIGPRALLDVAVCLRPIEDGELRDVGFDFAPAEYFAAEEGEDLAIVLFYPGRCCVVIEISAPPDFAISKLRPALAIAAASVLLPFGASPMERTPANIAIGIRIRSPNEGGQGAGVLGLSLIAVQMQGKGSPDLHFASLLRTIYPHWSPLAMLSAFLPTGENLERRDCSYSLLLLL